MGILQWNRTNNSFTRFPESEVYGNANNVIYDITEDNKGNIWAASCGGCTARKNRKTRGVRYFPEKSFLN